MKDGYHHGALREALVKAATTLVREVGVESFSLRDAARTVGVSPSATYRHFENKSTLLTAVAAAGVEKLGQRMRRRLMAAARAEGEPRARAIECFKETGRAYCAYAADQPDLFRLVYGPHGLPALSRSCAVGGAPGPFQVLGEALDGLVRVGLLPAARRAGGEFRAWTVLHGFATLVLEDTPIFATPTKRAEALDGLLDFALDGLCGRSAKGG